MPPKGSPRKNHSRWYSVDSKEDSVLDVLCAVASFLLDEVTDTEIGFIVQVHAKSATAPGYLSAYGVQVLGAGLGF